MLHYPLIHKGVNSARMITRARILTTLVRGHANQDICLALDVTLPSASQKDGFCGGVQRAGPDVPRCKQDHAGLRQPQYGAL